MIWNQDLEAYAAIATRGDEEYHLCRRLGGDWLNELTFTNFRLLIHHQLEYKAVWRKRKLVMELTYNSNTWEMEAGESRVQEEDQIEECDGGRIRVVGEGEGSREEGRTKSLFILKHYWHILFLLLCFMFFFKLEILYLHFKCYSLSSFP